MKVLSADGKLFKVLEVVSFLAYVNFLWVFFTIVGLGILGWMPATIALFSVMRRWILGKEITNLFSYFSEVYRKEFFKSNQLGLVIAVIGCILLFDLVFLHATNTIFLIIRSIILILCVCCLIILLYIFPVYVHYQMPNKDYVKLAFLMGLAFPHLTGLLGASLIGLFFVFSHIPGIVPFFGGSIVSYIILFQGLQVFKKAEKRQNLLLIPNNQDFQKG